MYKEWTDWLRHAEPLKSRVYCVGCLAIDRLHDAQLDKLAKLLMALSQLGYVRLYQKRDQHLMHYYVEPCFRPLIEQVKDGAKVKRIVDGVEQQVMVYGELQSMRGSRGHEHGCIAEAEALAGLPFTERRAT